MMHFNSSSALRLTALVLTFLWFAACTPLQPVAPPPARSPSQPADTPSRERTGDETPAAFSSGRGAETGPSSSAPSPKTLASLNLVQQARELLERGRPGESIRVLERALRIDPGNGQSAFYLAEAWIMKGDLAQAEAFHRVASSQLSGSPDWAARLRDQGRRLNQE